MDHTWNEIHEQPAVLERLLAAVWTNVQAIAESVRKRGVHWALLAARGSSDHAAIYAQYLLGMRQRLPAALATPSLYTLYQSPPRLEGALVVGVSQSGMSPDIVAVIEEARRQGQITIAVTNDPSSRLGVIAEFIIPLHAGEERSVAATKTYTAELMVVAMLSAALTADSTLLTELQSLPQAIDQVLSLNANVTCQAERYRYMTQTVTLGRGLTYSTALEAGLKLKEMTYISANAYSSADFLHGPIAILQPGFPLVAVAPAGHTLPDMLNVINECRSRGAEPIVVSDMPEALNLAQTPLPLPAGIPEWLAPIAAIVPAQLFARALALAKGYNPDQPRGLHKITETR
jgi:glucosamine--fructose-6-phosphate aminotransferase (isomerizing)